MSLDLRDLRIKVTQETYAWLEARSRVSGDDVSHIVRELLHAQALSEMRVASLMDQQLRREGLPGICGDCPGGGGKR